MYLFLSIATPRPPKPHPDHSTFRSTPIYLPMDNFGDEKRGPGHNSSAVSFISCQTISTIMTSHLAREFQNSMPFSFCIQCPGHFSDFPNDCDKSPTHRVFVRLFHDHELFDLSAKRGRGGIAAVVGVGSCSLVQWPWTLFILFACLYIYSAIERIDLPASLGSLGIGWLFSGFFPLCVLLVKEKPKEE